MCVLTRTLQLRLVAKFYMDSAMLVVPKHHHNWDDVGLFGDDDDDFRKCWTTWTCLLWSCQLKRSLSTILLHAYQGFKRSTFSPSFWQICWMFPLKTFPLQQHNTLEWSFVSSLSCNRMHVAISVNHIPSKINWI